jgi:hypothetical protein
MPACHEQTLTLSGWRPSSFSRSQTAVDQGFHDVQIEGFGEKAVMATVGGDALTG